MRGERRGVAVRILGMMLLGSVLLLGAVGCGKKDGAEPEGSASTGAGGGPSGKAVAGLDGDTLALLSAPGPLTEDLVQRLEALRIRRLWLLAGTFSGVGEPFRAVAPPALKYRMPLGVMVVIRPSWQAKLAGGGAEGAAGEVATALRAAAQAYREKGNEVAGAHVLFVDGPMASGDLKSFLEALRKGLADTVGGPLTVTPPAGFEKDPEAASVLSRADAWVPLVLGTPLPVTGEVLAKFPPSVDMAAADGVGAPFLAGFWLAGGGLLLDPGQTVVQEFPESGLDRFTEIPGIRLSLGSAFEDEGGYTYRLNAPKPANVLGTPIPAGAETRFRGITSPELVASLGDLARGQWKSFGGRVYFATDFPQSDGSLGVEAIEDAVAGRTLAPDPAVYVDEREIGKRGGVVELSLVNRNGHPSLVSQFSNWVELRIPKGSLAGIDPGRFDRYELWEGDGPSARAVGAVRADRVRLFEFYLGPRERVSTGAIRIQGDPAKISLEVSWNLVGGDGSELSKPLAPAQPTPVEAPAEAATAVPPAP